MVQQAESWRERVLGTPGRPDPTRPGESKSIQSVIGAYIRNDAKQSPEAVSREVNRALQDEAGDLILGQQSAQDELDYWHGEVDRGAGKAAQEQAAEVARSMGSRYDAGRADLGEAVRLAQRSGRVLLDPTTCKWVVELDHDGVMSKAMDVDVQTMFTPNPAYKGLPQATAETRRASVRADVSLTPEPGRARAPQASREPTPIREALHEAIAEIRAADAAAKSTGRRPSVGRAPQTSANEHDEPGLG